MYVQNPNIGGAVGKVLNLDADYGQCIFGMVNYEPGLMTGTTRQTIFDIKGSQYVRANSVINRSQDSTTVNYCYILGVASPMTDKYLAAPQTAYQRSFDLAELRTKVDVGENVVFEGMSANCTNTSGAALSGGIACQGDLTIFTG